MPVTKKLTILNKKGLHARASARFVRTIEEFDAKIIVSKDETNVGGTSIMGLMMLAASKGSQIEVSAAGPDAALALAAIEALLEDRFGEDE